jgi:hypothetical protein
MMNWEGFGRKQSWPNAGTIPAFSWRDQGKTLKASVMVASAPAEVLLVHRPNSSLERYLETCQFDITPCTYPLNIHAEIIFISRVPSGVTDLISK